MAILEVSISRKDLYAGRYEKSKCLLRPGREPRRSVEEFLKEEILQEFKDAIQAGKTFDELCLERFGKII